MLNTANARRSPTLKPFVFLILLALPLALFGGDPIPGMDITVEQSPPGIKQKGTTNAAGELILSGFRPGAVVVTVVHGGTTAVMGKTSRDKVILPGKGRGTVKPIRLDLSLYAKAATVTVDSKPMKRANHNTTRSNKGAARTTSAEASVSGTRATDYNSSRSNKQGVKYLDEDDDDDGIPTGESVAREVSDAKDNDCDGVIEITPLPNGRIKIKATCQ